MAKINNYIDALRNGMFASRKPLSGLAFIDVEVGLKDKRAHDYAATLEQGEGLHTQSRTEFAQFVAEAEYLCGHNIIHHDLKYLADIEGLSHKKPIDTLYLSPLLFPQRPYHRLLKDDKLQTDELNNPLNDCQKARELFYDEINAFRALPKAQQDILHGLLHRVLEFSSFFDYIAYIPENKDIKRLIAGEFTGKICMHSDIGKLRREQSVELAYALALIATGDRLSITPPWLLHTYPEVEYVLKQLCNNACHDPRCTYCSQQLDIHLNLKQIFGYDQFRTFDGEPMQARAVQAAVDGRSLLTIFPTGGGKSLTFQLPAIMQGRAVHGLTVIISPLQSLMKDQVDNMVEQGLSETVTINGLLDPLSRAEAIERVANGSASLLYIAPEMLRSKTLERLLLQRNVVRIVVDEAHCFSSWGQDFRVDYLYIGDFIKRLQEQKHQRNAIPISCFTATAKPKVIADIRDYFKRKLDVDLELYASKSARKNLQYSVLHAESEENKYNLLRSLMLSNDVPTIVYVSRTKKTHDLAKKLSSDGISALPFNGKMDANEKIANQNDFVANRVRAMVATSAFGMGVNKKDVGMVVHYDISDSLENYVQEAGRAGRDPSSAAKCYVLYNDNDLDKHFILLNQTKVSISEIQQVWKSIKDFTKQRGHVCCSALEIARQAGWNDEVHDVETRVRTAISALEEAGYVSRGHNVPHVFATGIMVKNMDDARRRIDRSPLFTDSTEKQNAVRIIKSLISSKSRAVDDNDAESRVDYLADRLGMTKEAVVSAVNMLRQEGILADSMDISAHFDHSEHKSRLTFEQFAKLERFVLTTLAQNDEDLSFKNLNEKATEANIPSSPKKIKTLLYFLTVKSYIKKKENAHSGIVRAVLNRDLEQTLQRCQRRFDICNFVIDKLYKLALQKQSETQNSNGIVQFSVVGILKELEKQQSTSLFQPEEKYQIHEIEDALLYLSTIGSIKLEGGFMVLYNAMEIHRLKEMRLRYKIEDYRLLDKFYRHKRQQIHIVGEYANMMVRDYNSALRYVQDYFQLDYKLFISKYFKGERLAEIERNITPEKYAQLFGTLSVKQRKIIDDKQSKYIVVAAGPGSGKTRVLVHKLASLLLLEDVKHEQLLMLTFSRAAATEFKQRLIELIGNAAYFVEIKTFHGFSFDLLGKVGSLDDSEHVVQRAAEMIEQGDAEQGRINRAVLVIDEAQDMDANEYRLVRALMANNEEMRVIAVGDDDQNIFQFRGADSRHMQAFVDEWGATKYEMAENYRSTKPVVEFANWFAQRITQRMKTQPSVAIQGDSGCVQIRHYASENIEMPLVEHLLATYSNERACVLTNTNDEAARIVGLLQKQGVKAKLIQSMDGFRFGNLAEVRYFVKLIDQGLQSPVISHDRWQRAKERVLATYESSTCIEYIKQFFAVFERTNRTMYRSDLADFVYESKLEDFCGDGQSAVFVSTIHKAKGREFDTVYMHLNAMQADTNEQLRKLYVGITRAKQNLYIHCNTPIFGTSQLPFAQYAKDATQYDAPDEIVQQLGLKDVWLSFFKEKKAQILNLRCGMPLQYENGFLLKNSRQLGSLSKQKRDELQAWEQKGYSVSEVRVGYIVAWREKTDTTDTEIAVILPELVLQRKR